MSRPLNAEEAALWERVVATVRPLGGAPRAIPKDTPVSRALPTKARPARGAVPAPAAPPQRPGEHLDGSWDRRIARGTIEPDRIVDLHGHSLASAYDLLDHALERAIGAGERTLLLVTGKPPGAAGRRGAIRAAVGDWLAASRHGRRIAAVRGAHPRHGGAGALYIILRRERS